MAAILNLLKSVLGVKANEVIVEDIMLAEKDQASNKMVLVDRVDGKNYEDAYGADSRPKVIMIKAHPAKGSANRCPHCGRECKPYDREGSMKLWRTLDIHNCTTFIMGPNHRVECPEHGHVTVAVPWALPGSSFSVAFEHDVSYAVKHMNKSAVAEYYGIDWSTVGRILERTLHVLEPDPLVRLQGLESIGVDETSYAGRKYITVVVNHDKNEVVWASEGCGDEVFSKFCKLLTPEQRAAIRVVTGDSAGWVTRCCKKYFPNATRCADAFHVVKWANEAMDEVRRDVANEATRRMNKLMKEADQEAKKEALGLLQAELDKRLAPYEQKVKDLKAEEASLREAKACILETQQAYRDELPGLRALSGEYRLGAQALYRHACNLTSGETQRNLMLDALTLGYGYFDLKAVIDEEEGFLSDSKGKLKEIGKQLKAIGSERRAAVIVLRGEREKAKQELKAAEKKSYRYGQDGNPDTSDGATSYSEEVEEAIKEAAMLKKCKYVFLHNQENLYENQETKRKLIIESIPAMGESYALKEQLRLILHSKDPDMVDGELTLWVKNARACGIKPFEKLADKIERQKEYIVNTVRLGVSNARVEATNTNIKLIIRRAHGFHSVEALIAMVMYVCSSLEAPRSHKGRAKALQR